VACLLVGTIIVTKSIQMARKMKSILNIPAELLTSIDMINTLSGGLSQPEIRFQQFETYRQINVNIPSVDIGSIKIEIRNNVLMIYYLIPLMSQDQVHNYPKVIYNKPIPYFVDRDGIVAQMEERQLVVTLPYNELSGGFKKQIPIAY
jgi:HSP20 family molecular chaperone IbpA